MPTLNTVAICLSAACFFLELSVGRIWSVPMDIAPRYAGSASGMMNFGFGIAGILSPYIFGLVVDRTGSNAALGLRCGRFGIGAPDARGQTIRRGTNDDALGIAGVLELAHAYV